MTGTAEKTQTEEQAIAALRAEREDVIISDSYYVPAGHAGVNAALQRARIEGTWETDEHGRVTHVEGRPVRNRGEGSR